MNKARVEFLFMGMALAAAVGISWQLFPAATGHHVELAWDPNPETNITGYIVTASTTNGPMLWQTNVGPVTQAVIALPEFDGVSYSFVVQAQNDANLKGEPSNEVTYRTSDTPPPPPPVTNRPPALIKFRKEGFP